MKPIRFYLVRGSKQVEQIGYDHETTTLYVKFPGCSLYSYASVPPFTVAAVMFAESVGSAFNAQIKGGEFAYQKLQPDHEAFKFLVGEKVTVS